MADLVTLNDVKRYLAIFTTNQDTLIEQLIPRASRQIEQWTSRRFPSVTNTAKRLNGTGGAMLMLPDSPIISVDLLQLEGTTIAASPDGIAFGHVFDDTTVYLKGAIFPQGRQNVVCTWTAGYRESESGTIPTGNTPTLTPTTGGAAASMVSVTSAAGVVFAAVSNAPVSHQYSFANGTLTFNSSDANTSVTMVYDYVPPPVVQAAIEMIGMDLKQRDNLGVNSKSLAGEVVTYSDRGMSASVREMLQPYRRMAPC